MPSLAEIYLARGQAQSNAELRKAAIEAQRGTQNAAIWGNTLSNIGQTVAGAVTEYGRQKQNAPIIAAETENRRLQGEVLKGQLGDAQDARDAAKAEPGQYQTDMSLLIQARTQDPTLGAAMIDHAKALELFTAAGRLNRYEKLKPIIESYDKNATEATAKQAAAMKDMAGIVADGGFHPSDFIHGVDDLVQRGLMSETYAMPLIDRARKDPDFVKNFTMRVTGQKEAAPLVTKPGDVLRDPTDPSKVLAKNPAAEPPAATPFQTATLAETTRHNKAMEAQSRLSSGEGSSTDVKEAVMGMKEGTIPPQLPGRALKEYTAMMAEARRQGFDLAGAATDWMATQKHVATLNGAQQTRLNQAVNQLPELLDTVEGLAKQWKGGKFPILNKANLALAKGGAYGKDAASIANQLDAQIADVNADLATVYMGGNSPTDHGLELAGKALKSEWDEKVLMDMIGLARKNVQTRHNSIRSVGVQGASADNPYGPQGQQTASPPTSVAPTPARPAGVPPNAVWDPVAKRWRVG